MLEVGWKGVPGLLRYPSKTFWGGGWVKVKVVCGGKGF